MSGERINNIEVTRLLQPFAISQATLHQFADGSLRLRIVGAGNFLEKIRVALLALFGPGQRLEMENVATFDGKVVQYTTDLIDEGVS